VVDVGDNGEISGQLGGHGQREVGGDGARESRKFTTRHEKSRISPETAAATFFISRATDRAIDGF
jgi:hypothetical protein